MKITILNSNSLLNPGDAAILEAQIALLRELRPDCRIAVTSRTPELDGPHFAPRGVTVHRAVLPAPSLVRGAAAKLAACARDAGRIGGKSRLIREILGSDLVIAGGGGIFFSNRRHAPGLTFAQNILHVRLAQALGKTIVFFPQSFGPFASRPAARATARMLSHPETAAIMVRESLSAEALARLLPAAAREKISLCPDLAFRFEPRPVVGGPRLDGWPRPRLVVALRDWDFPEASGPSEKDRLRRRYLESVRSAVARFARARGGSVVLVPQTRGPGDAEDDRVITRELQDCLRADLPADRLAVHELPATAGPDVFPALYAQADLVLAARTHAALFGLLAGRPVVSIHYQPKGLGIMASLGLARQTLPIAKLEGPRLQRTLEEAAEQTEAGTARILCRISALKEEIGIRIARVLDEAERRP